MRHVNFMEHLLQDLRFTIRQLLRYRGFATAAIVVPALLASYVPASRAASVNPIEVLRAE